MKPLMQPVIERKKGKIYVESDFLTPVARKTTVF
jgi:hypothetical protein